MSQPRMRIVPEVGATRPIIMAIVVVLPAPLPPSKPTIWPDSMENEPPATAGPPGYCFARLETTMAGSVESMATCLLRVLCGTTQKPAQYANRPGNHPVNLLEAEPALRPQPPWLAIGDANN